MQLILAMKQIWQNIKDNIEDKSNSFFNYILHMI